MSITQTDIIFMSLCCEHGPETLFLSGESSETIVASKESTVPFSEMKATILPASLSDRLTHPVNKRWMLF